MGQLDEREDDIEPAAGTKPSGGSRRVGQVVELGADARRDAEELLLVGKRLLLGVGLDRVEVGRRRRGLWLRLGDG